MLQNEIQIDVEAVLEELGIRNIKEAGPEWNYSCPNPDHSHGDHRPSAYMRGSYPYPFICFGCGQQGTVVDFVADYLGIDRSKAWKWLGERFGFGDLYDPTVTLTDTLSRIFGAKTVVEKKELVNPEIKPHGFVPLETVRPGWDYMIERGLQPYTLKQFKFQWDSRSGRVAIPIYDRLNRLIGFKARDITGYKEPKYLVLGDRKYTDYGFKPYNSSLVLYGFNLFDGLQLPRAILVEGELNALRIYEAGFHPLGLPTASLSFYQAALIREYFDEVVIFTDSDEAGVKGANAALNLLGGACRLKIVKEHENDPMEMTTKEITELINTAQSPLIKQIKGE